MPRTSTAFACMVIAAVVALGATPARADTIQLGGSVTLPTSYTAQFTLTGTGFSLHGGASDFAEFAGCTSYGPCFAGATIPLNLLLAGTIGGGSGTVNGTYYPQLSIGGNLQFVGSGSFTGSGPTVVVTAPFSLAPNSSLNAFTGPALDTQVFSVPVSGSGIATLTLHSDPSYGLPGAYSFTSLRYDFSNTAVTPEPASMLLLGSGMGLTALAARRRRRARTA